MLTDTEVDQALPLPTEPPFLHLQNGNIMEEKNCYLQLPSKEGELLLPAEYLDG